MGSDQLVAESGGNNLVLVPSTGGFQARALAKRLEPLASRNVSTGLCNSPHMYFGVSKYFPSFFIRRNIAEGPSERNGILKECLGKALLAESTGGVSLTVGADGHT